MNRDIQKVLSEYNSKFEKRTDRRGKFFPSDINQIARIAHDQGIGQNVLFFAIQNALEVGFMIGYKYSKREGRKKTTSTNNTKEQKDVTT